MPRFSRLDHPIVDSNTRDLRGNHVLHALQRSLKSSVENKKAIIAAGIVMHTTTSWNSFGWCGQLDDNHNSIVFQLLNRPFPHCDSTQIMSIAYIMSCVCSDIITNHKSLTSCKRSGEFLKVVIYISFLFFCMSSCCHHQSLLHFSSPASVSESFLTGPIAFHPES